MGNYLVFFSEMVCVRSLRNRPRGYIGWKEHISPLQPVAEGWGEIRGSWQRHALRKCKNTFLIFWLSQGQTNRDNPKQRGIKSTRRRWSSDSGFLLLKLRHQEQSYIYYHYIKNGNPFGQLIHHESFSPLRNCGPHPDVRYPITVWGQPDPPSSRWWSMSCPSGNWILPAHVQLRRHFLSYQPLPERSKWCSGAHPHSFFCVQLVFLTSLYSAVWTYPAMYRKWGLVTAGALITMVARAANSTQGFAQGTRTSNAASK